MNKSYHLNPWFSFITLCVVTAFGLYAGSLVWILIFGFGALIAYPNKKFQGWVDEKKQKAVNLLLNLFYLGIVLLVIVGVIWGVGKIFSGIAGLGKYEGMSAKEWFNEYDYTAARYETLKGCVEENTTYYGFEDYEELQYQLEEIESCL